MKKTLIAVAALAATGAFAQSSVELYGIVDLGYHNEKLTQTGAADLKRTGLASVQNGSRIGFRGTEDLGGGLKANFVLEYGITPDESTTPFAFNRQSYVGVSGGFGEVRLGRQYTLQFENAVAGDVMGSLYAQAGSLVYLDNQARINNAVTYKSPNFNGFTVHAQYGFGEQVLQNGSVGGSSAASARKSDTTGLRLNYANGPLAAGLSYEKAKNVNLTIGNWVGTAGMAIKNVDKKSTNLYAKYDFGMATVFWDYNNTKVNTTVAGAPDTKWTANNFGVSAPVASNVNLLGSLGTGKFKTDGVAAEIKAKGYQLGAQYILSKRTLAYVYTGQTKLDQDAANAHVKFTTYSVGLNHKF